MLNKVISQNNDSYFLPSYSNNLIQYFLRWLNISALRIKNKAWRIKTGIRRCKITVLIGIRVVIPSDIFVLVIGFNMVSTYYINPHQPCSLKCTYTNLIPISLILIFSVLIYYISFIMYYIY